jgi:hypothetical protein
LEIPLLWVSIYFWFFQIEHVYVKTAPFISRVTFIDLENVISK